MEEADGKAAANGNGTSAVSAAQAIANAALAEAMTSQHQKKQSQQKQQRVSDDDSKHPSKTLHSATAGEEDSEDGSEQDKGVEAGASLSHHRQSLGGILSQKRRANQNQTPTSSTANDDSTSTGQGNPQTMDGRHQHVKDSEAENMKQKLDGIWKFLDKDGEDPHEQHENIGGDPEERFQQAYDNTMTLVSQYVDSLVQEAVQVCHQMEERTRQLELAKETLASKDKELQRLKETVTTLRTTIQNLLRATEQHKADAKDASKWAVTEAQLRSELQKMATQKDKAIELVNESQRKYSRLENELEQTKLKLTKAEEEKVKLERDRNLTMTWARSVDNNTFSDCDFYKRKVAEQNTHIQGLNAVVAEKNCQIEDMRRQIERSMSNNRLSQFRTSQTDHASKKARRSF